MRDVIKSGRAEVPCNNFQNHALIQVKSQENINDPLIIKGNQDLEHDFQKSQEATLQDYSQESSQKNEKTN